MGKVFCAVGDGATGTAEALQVADIIAADNPELFLWLGDCYEQGTPEEWAHNYAPVYGQLDDIVLGTPGNHDYPNYETGYKWYFGSRCKLMHGKATYYSFRFGSWQILSINSEEPHDAASPQYTWLQGELSKTWYGKRRIAFWHRPRYCSGSHGNAPDMEPIMELLKGKCAIALSGHAHNAQIFQPDERGITQFISGAGGRSHYATILDDPKLLFSSADTFGAMRFELDGNTVHYRYVALEKGILYEGEIQV